MQLLRMRSTQPNQLTLFLPPLGGGMPTPDAEFSQLVTQLRRHGHVSERTHGNTAAVLCEPLRQTRLGAYFAEDTQDPLWSAVRPEP